MSRNRELLFSSRFFVNFSITKIIIMVLIVVGIIVLIAIWVMSLYNNLVKLRNRRQNAFADIDVQLRQRHDLVPQLVETVKDQSGTTANVSITGIKSAGRSLSRSEGQPEFSAIAGRTQRY